MRNLKRITAFFLMAVIVTTAFPVLADTSWETMIRDEYFLNDVWRYRAEYSDSYVLIDTQTARGGNASLKISNKTIKGAVNSYITASNKSVVVEKGKTYRFEFDAKAENAMGVYIIIDGVSKSLIPSGKTYDWMPIAFTYTSQKDGNIEFRFTVNNRTDAFWVDNIKVYDINNPSVNLVADGDFEDLDGVKEISSSKAEATTDADEMYSRYGTMQIDGKLNDWEGYETFEITGLQDYTNYVWKNVAPQMVGYVRYAHDEKNFYFAVDVEDKTHYAFPDVNTYWKGDSLQFGWGDPRMESPQQVERGAAYYPDRGVIHKTKEDFDVAIVREGTKTYYEVAVPWTSDFSGEMPPDILFNLVINSNDGNGRDYSIELAPGITNGKEIKYYKHLNLWQNVGNIEHSASAPKNANIFENVIATVALKNKTNRAENAVVESAQANFKKRVTVDPMSTQYVDIPYKVGDAGNYQLKFSIESGGEKIELIKNTVVKVIYNAESYPKLRKKLEEQEKEIKELLLQCEKKGMQTPYEVANHSILERFIRLLDEEALIYNDYSRMYDYEIMLTDIYTETRDTLKAYLAGEKEPLAGLNILQEQT